MDDTCVVCAETLEWVAYSPCGHREVCSTCIARLRFICNDRRCCICKFESNAVFVTKALGDYTNVIKDFSVLPSDPKEGRVGRYWYHEGTQAYFDDADHFKMIKETCKLTCSVCDKQYDIADKKSKGRGAFADIERLKSHLLHQHKLSMCNLCLEGRKVFICEQKLFTREQLSQHISTGNSEVDGSESERGGFNGHPSCRFCRNHFYGDNELYLHMSTEHYTCHICLRRHPGQYDYYNNYNDLENHFRADHYLCENDSCLAKKFVVFASEPEMKRHNAMEHGGQMSRSQRNSALQISVSFQFRETSEQERRRRRRGSHFSSDNQSLAALQANIQSVNGDAPHLSSSSGGIESSNELNTHGTVAVVDRFETLSTLDGPAQITNQRPLQESLFPPLPTVQRNSQKKSKNKSANNTMAAHLRHRSVPSAAGHASRVTPVVGLRGAPSNNAWLTPATAASSSSKPVLASKSVASTSSDNVHPSRPMNIGSLIIGNASSSRSSVIPSLTEGKAVSVVTVNRSASSQVKGKSPVGDQHSMQVDTSQHANKQLVEKIRSILQFDNDKYAVFKEISMQFRQGLIDSGEYLLHVHQFGLSDLIPELAKLLPDSQKQKELIDTYNYNFMQNGFHRDGVGQSTSHLAPYRNGKEKLLENGITSSRNSTNGPSYAQLIKEANSANQNNKGKSKGLIAGDEGTPGVNSQSQLNRTVQPQSVTPLQISEPGPSSKKIKKKSKFLRARLGESVEAPEQLDDQVNAHANSQSSAGTGPVVGAWVSGAWVNGGGRKLVANLSNNKKAAKKII